MLENIIQELNLSTLIIKDVWIGAINVVVLTFECVLGK